MNLEKIVLPHILQLSPYSSARDEYKGKEGVFLDANENPFASAEGFNRYPDPQQWAVKEKISVVKNVRPTQIFLGNGSDEAIDLIIRACCEPKQDNIVILPPTYGMYQVCADIQNISTIKVPLSAEYDLDVPAILEVLTPQTKIIWVCSPNNPSGNLVDRNRIISLLENFTGLVVVDEAYIDFASTTSFTQFLDTYPNLVVLQTFSKAWGLAGLRLGMAFASEEFITILNKIKYPYNINVATQKLLLKALSQADRKDKMVLAILKERDYLSKKLAQLSNMEGISPSDANMLLVKFKNAHQLFEYLIGQKIIVRDRSKVKYCEDCLRITVGTRRENNLLLAQIREFIKK